MNDPLPDFCLTDLPELVGFFSYSREDDDDAAGRLSALRDAIQRELRGQLGRTRQQLRLWQDKEAIVPGRLWEREIKTAIQEAVFFIPIITPTVVNSTYCRSEFEFFLEQERALGRSDLVFPIIYIRVPELARESRWRDHPVLSVIGRRQWVDWRQLRLLPVDDLAVRRAIEELCGKIIETLGRPMTPLEELRRQRQAKEDEERTRQEEDRKRREEEARLAAVEAETALKRQKEKEQEEAKRAEDAARAKEAELRHQAEMQRQRENEEEDARRAREAETVRERQHEAGVAVQYPEQHQQTPPSKRPIFIGAAVAAGIALAVLLTVVVMREHPNPAPPAATLQAVVPAPQAPTPADAAVQRQKELTAREQQTYDAARGNVATLRAYVNGCTICAYESAARAEIAQLQTTDQEERTYTAARGNRDALRAYVSSCSVCAHADAARDEIARLETVDREERSYNAARGNRDALQGYVDGCTACVYAGAARTEIARLEPQPLPCGGNTDAQLVRPIESLYRAVNQRDLDLYAQQWADGATSRDVFSGGSERTKEQKVDTKRKQFPNWRFNLTMDRPPEILSRTATQAEIGVYYSIAITFAPGDCKKRTGVLEKYTLTCGDTGRWQIIDNTDEINVSGSADRC